MKKLYIQPQTDVCEVLTTTIIAGSVTGSVDGGDGPGYGGVDDDGTQDPGVKRQGGHYNVWDDDWREQ